MGIPTEDSLKVAQNDHDGSNLNPDLGEEVSIYEEGIFFGVSFISAMLVNFRPQILFALTFFPPTHYRLTTMQFSKFRGQAPACVFLQ